jgi:hypothetical protein
LLSTAMIVGPAAEATPSGSRAAATEVLADDADDLAALREAIGGLPALLETLGAMAMLPLAGALGGAVRAAVPGDAPIDPAGAAELPLRPAEMAAVSIPDDARSAAARSLDVGRAGDAGAGGVAAGATPADDGLAVPPATEPVTEGGAALGGAGTALGEGESAGDDAVAGTELDAGAGGTG